MCTHISEDISNIIERINDLTIKLRKYPKYIYVTQKEYDAFEKALFPSHRFINKNTNTLIYPMTATTLLVKNNFKS